MGTITIIDRPMTDAEFAQRCAGAAAFARACGVPPQTREQHDIIALDGDAFIGCATGYVYQHGSTYNGWMYLYNLYLEPPYRRLGYGAHLLRTLEERVAELGVTRVWTHTVSYEAPGFYQKQGYDIFYVREQRHTDAHSEIFLRKSLTNQVALAEMPDPGHVRFVERPITEAELALVNAGFNIHTREHGCPVQTLERHGYVALDGDTFAGCVSGLARKDGEIPNRWFFLTDLHVEAAYRGHGLGTTLLQRIEAHIAAVGTTRISTEMAEYEAVRFLQQHGYAEMYAFEEWYPGRYRRIYMEKGMKECDDELSTRDLGTYLL